MKEKSTKQPKKSAKKRSRRAVANVIAEPVPPAAQDYVTAFNRLFARSDEIVGWKVTRTLEEAKRLSINAEFQKALETIRKRYQISPKRQRDVIEAQVVLADYTVHLSDQDKENLNSELSALADKFDLRWFDEGEDYGLIIGALCYGLTPNNLTEHWDEIKYSMSKTRTPGARLFLDHGQRIKDSLSAMVAISFLFLRLHEAGFYLKDLPEPVREIVMEALKTVGHTGDNAETAARAIEKFRDTYIDPDLFIKITSETSLEDIKRTWPQVEMRKKEWLRNKKNKPFPTRTRVWRTYDRDIFIWRRVKEDGMSWEKAFDEWLRVHPEDAEDAVELSAVIKAVKRITFVPKDSEL